MTEVEWTTSNKARKMLQSIMNNPIISNRKLRLFACACVRSVWDLLENEKSRYAVQMSEKFADGLISSEELEKARHEAQQLCSYVTANALKTDAEKANVVAWIAYFCTRQTWGSAYQAALIEAWNPGKSVQANLLRDIMGNPLHPTEINSKYITPTVTSLAISAYNKRDTQTGHLDRSRLSILADALEDQGDNILYPLICHLRNPEKHVRGCWALDTVLRKK